MRVFLDDQPCNSNAASIGDAIAACAAMAEERGRYVVEVVVDGTRLTSEHLESQELTSAKASEVRLSSAEPAELVSGTFAEAADALEEARAIQNDAAAMLQRDTQPQAMEKLGEAFAIWMSVRQAVQQGAQFAGLDLDTCSVNDQPASETVANLSKQLESLRTQLENGDTVGVADTLLYELPDVIDQWRALLNHLREAVRSSQT